MPGTKISELQDGGALQSTDSFPIARGVNSRRIQGSDLLNRFTDLSTRINTLSGSTITVRNSPTINLSYNSTTRLLSADTTSAIATKTQLDSLSADITTKVNNSSLPSGMIVVFPATVAPTGWLALSGQTISRTTYSTLWNFASASGNVVTDAQWTSLSAFGAFSQGDGSTTFRLPDLRGHFVRGSGTHTDRTASGSFGRKQDDAFQGHIHYQQGGFSGNGDENDGGNKITYWGRDPSGITGGPMNDGTNGDPRVASETRPDNIALLYCIKT